MEGDSVRDGQSHFGGSTVGVLNRKDLKLIYHVTQSMELSNASNFCILFTFGNPFTFYGKACVSHIYGPSVTIMGATISSNNPGPYTIFSPNSHALLTFSLNAPSSAPCAHNSATSESEGLSEFLPLLRSSIRMDSLAVDCVIDHVIEAYKSMTCKCSILFFNSYTCRLSDSIQSVKRFGNLYSLSLPNAIPTPTKISRSLGFCFIEGDASGFHASSEMYTLAERFARHTVKPTKLLLAGPKSAGKSSLLRFLVNYFLTERRQNGVPPQVAVLDVDVGQPEFTPCGMVSLTLVSHPIFGPPFTHHILKFPRPVCQCFVGSITPSENPDFYLKCFEYVFRAYMDLPDPKPPLVVNTMGWTQGLGLALLVEQIALMKPNIVAQIQLNPRQPNARFNLPILDAPTLQGLQGWGPRDLSLEPFDHEVFVVQCVAYPISDRPSYSFRSPYGAPDHRDLTLLAYFMSQLENAPTSLPSRPKTSPLGHPVAHFLDCLPYHVPVADPLVEEETQSNGDSESMSTDRIVREDELTENSFRLAVCLMDLRAGAFDPPAYSLPLTLETIMACVNATIVALCAVPVDQIHKCERSRLSALVPSNPVCECFGFAICRAVDSKAGILYLTTGVAPENLSKVTAIVRGRIDLPACFFLEQPILFSSDDCPLQNELPYLGPSDTQGIGRVALPSRRAYPRTPHHSTHRTGSSESPTR